MSVPAVHRLLNCSLRACGYHQDDPWANQSAINELIQNAQSDEHHQMKANKLRYLASTARPPPAEPRTPLTKVDRPKAINPYNTSKPYIRVFAQISIVLVLAVVHVRRTNFSLLSRKKTDRGYRKYRVISEIESNQIVD